MFKVLSHLPVYGPAAIPFPTDKFEHHKEGYVVEFEDKQGKKWIGNFQKGLSSYSNAFGELGRDIIFVVAGGSGYTIDVNSRNCIDETGGAIDWCLPLPEKSALVISHGVDFEAIDKNGRIWVSDRISWDGFKELSYSDGKIQGKAYSPLDDDYHSFELNITDGSFIGGSYNGP